MPQDTPQEPQSPQASSPAGRKILCIEDEHFIGELYARALSKAGYQAKIIIDGVEGLKEAQTNQYDIILLDIMVPNMTGTEILQRLRDPAQTPQLKAKIIITTNLEQKDDARQLIERQADGYLIKAEVTPRQLIDILKTIN